jgi:hypothetical protein
LKIFCGKEIAPSSFITMFKRLFRPGSPQRGCAGFLSRPGLPSSFSGWAGFLKQGGYASRDAVDVGSFRDQATSVLGVATSSQDGEGIGTLAPRREARAGLKGLRPALLPAEGEREN